MALIINGYDSDKFKSSIEGTTHHAKILELEQHKNFKISYERTYDGKFFTGHLLTPREYYYHPRLTVCSLYYINFLAELEPDQIIDIGCGMNNWKDFYPNIYGIDSEHPAADRIEKFDHDFSLRNTESHQCAFTIGGLVFNSFATIKDQMLDFINIIKPGGRGYMSFNVGRMLAHFTSKEDFVKILGKDSPTTLEISEYCDKIISELPVTLLVVDNLILERYNEFMDGNLRIVFEKPV